MSTGKQRKLHVTNNPFCILHTWLSLCSVLRNNRQQTSATKTKEQQSEDIYYLARKTVAYAAKLTRK